ncbi:MAG TPA: preprotein translocase subunit SecE [bacterium]|nr:preprotein translocase subunit SecE [bacterium]
MSNKLIQYFKDSKVELKKVVWPTKKQVLNHTLLVIGFSLGVAIFLGAVDLGLIKLVEKIIAW